MRDILCSATYKQYYLYTVHVFTRCSKSSFFRLSPVLFMLFYSNSMYTKLVNSYSKKNQKQLLPFILIHPPLFLQCKIF